MVFNEEAAFVEAFCARIQRLRVLRGLTQDEMATALGIPLARYKKYETRSPIPAYLIERFATIVGRDIEYVLTGKAPSRRRGPPNTPTVKAALQT